MDLLDNIFQTSCFIFKKFTNFANYFRKMFIYLHTFITFKYFTNLLFYFQKFRNCILFAIFRKTKKKIFVIWYIFSNILQTFEVLHVLLKTFTKILFVNYFRKIFEFHLLIIVYIIFKYFTNFMFF